VLYAVLPFQEFGSDFKLIPVVGGVGESPIISTRIAPLFAVSLVLLSLTWT
jgi:hypothetical protein